MGFYGNIANAAKTNFQFDKIYPSRYDMTISAANDNIFIGRYVLVEYDADVSNSQYDKNWFLRIIPTEDERNEFRLFTTYENEDVYHYSNSFLAQNALHDLAEECSDGEVIYFQPEHVITHVNTEIQYAKVYKNHDYELLTEEEFLNNIETTAEDWEAFITYIQSLVDQSEVTQEDNGTTTDEDPNYPGLEDDTDPDADEEIDEEPEIDLSQFPPFAHIANDLAYLSEADGFSESDEDTAFKYVVIPVGYNYLFNKDGEFWTLLNVEEKEYPDLELKGNIHTDNYMINFNIDKDNFHTERGYDSTVWVKAFANGVQKYIKVADLNTYVPSIGIEADPPTLIPTRPHWGVNSTNAYYQLHFTTPWGLRMKAASNILTLPTISPQGVPYGGNSDYTQNQGMYGRTMARDITSDGIYYPSDVDTTWKYTFQDYTKNDTNKKTLYYDPESQSWSEDSSKKVPAAIYFNKDGFNPEKIAYSEDLINSERDIQDSRYRYNATIARTNWTNEDAITITPTGASGHIYRKHDGTYHLYSGNDTQEISIMLPSIGDTIAKMWDIIYGGREFDFIKQTNRRSVDIEWEDARYDIRRSGLRLRGIYGNSYDMKAMSTLAGCINTAHDLLGMIIVSQTSEEMNNHLEDYSMDRIYYNSDTEEYYRKHKTYIYTPVSTSNPGPYYEPVVNPTDPDNPITEILDFPFGEYIWYRDYIGGNAKAAQETNKDPKLMSDYIVDPIYHPDRDYYKVTYEETNLAPEYEKDKYWYYEGRNLYLDRNEEQTENRAYYTLDKSNLVNLKDIHFGDEDDESINQLANYAKVYVPGKYYYRDAEGNYKVDVSPYGTFNDEDIPQEFYYTVRVVEEYNQTEEDRIIYVTVVSFERVIVTSSDFEPNVYYYARATTDEENAEYDATANNFKILAQTYDPNEQYYIKKISYVKMPANSMVNVEPDMSSETPRSNFFVYKTDTFFIENGDNENIDSVEYTMLTKEDFLMTENIDQMDIYVFGVLDLNDYNNPFRTIRDSINQNYTDILQLQDKFYMKNRYHQILPDGSIVLDTYKDMTPSARYCTILEVEKFDLEGKEVYSPGQYYQEDLNADEGFSLVTDATLPSQNLYRKQQLYVYSDTLNIMPRGMVWNVDATTVPSTITLAKRKDAWEMIPLEAYATSTTTMNGSILQMQQMLEPNDNLTRENDSVSGVMNQLKDLIRRFGIMKSNKILVIDSYGRVRTAEVDPNSSLEIAVDGNPENPSINIQTKSLDYRADLEQGTENPQSLQWLYSKVAALEERVNTLENNIATIAELEAKIAALESEP